MIFAAGAGMPYFSTDTVSVQRALETGCSEVIVGQERRRRRLHGGPASRPVRPSAWSTSRTATRLQKRLNVLDAAAFSLGMENGLPMVVFGLEEPGNVTRALIGERIGTLVTA